MGWLPFKNWIYWEYLCYKKQAPGPDFDLEAVGTNSM
jgi:hypothetical protein